MIKSGFAYNSSVPFISFGLKPNLGAISLNATTNNLPTIKPSKLTM
jgi:hypothetical protein